MRDAARGYLGRLRSRPAPLRDWGAAAALLPFVRNASGDTTRGVLGSESARIGNDRIACGGLPTGERKSDLSGAAEFVLALTQRGVDLRHDAGGTRVASAASRNRAAASRVRSRSERGSLIASSTPTASG
jgi:hypothetical protein